MVFQQSDPQKQQHLLPLLHLSNTFQVPSQRLQCCKSEPRTFIPIGARIPVCSMTSRVSMGCNFGAEVTPGNFGDFTISFQMSSGLLI